MTELETFRRYLGQLDELVAIFEAHPDERVRVQGIALLQAIDAVHRTALTRLVEVLRESEHDGAVERLRDDPVVAILLALYDLVELERPAPATESGPRRIPLEL